MASLFIAGSLTGAIHDNHNHSVDMNRFQQNGALPLYGTALRECLINRFPGRWI